MKFCTSVCLKPSNDRGEFEFDRVRSKNNIAENSFAIGHKTDKKYFLIDLIDTFKVGEMDQNLTTTIRYKIKLRHFDIKPFP